MFLGGIWHGANWTFLVWGLFHGLALVVERWMQGRTSFRPSPALSVFVVFHCVCFAWIFFRAPDLATALAGLAAFGDWSSPLQNLTPFLAGLVLLGLASQFLPPDLLDRTVARLERLPFLLQGAASGFVVVAIDAFGPEGVAPFIYFQF